MTLLLLCSNTVSAFDAWDVEEPVVKVDIQAKPGQWTLLAFWALDCAPCEQQKPRLSQFNQRYSQLNVFGIVIDGREQALAIQKRLQNNPVSFDTAVVDLDVFAKQYQKEFGRKFLATPTYVLYSPTGETLSIYTGSLNFSHLSRVIEQPLTTKPDTSLLR